MKIISFRAEARQVLNKMLCFGIIASCFGCFSATIEAQTRETPWAIGLYGVKTEYLGDMRYLYGNVSSDNPVNTIFNFEQFYGGAAISVDRYLSRFFDAGIYFSAGSLGYNRAPGKSTVYYSENVNNFKVTPLLNANVHLRIKFLGQENALVVPYAVLGAGGLGYMSVSTRIQNTRAHFQEFSGVTYDYTQEKSTDYPAYSGIASGGLGVEFNLSKHFAVRYQAEAGWTTADNNDLCKIRNGNDWQLQHSLGLVYSFGKKTAKKEKTQAVKPIVEETYTPVEKQPEPVVTEPVKEDIVKPEPVIETKPVKKEAPTVNNLLFALNKAELTTETKATLDASIHDLRETGVSILIKGHTDNIGSEEYNQKLSIRRADAVKKYLIEKGISQEKIVVQGFGETQPIADNNSENGRSKNRRVELIIK